MDGHSMYSESSQKVDTFTYTLINPAFGGSVRGVQILNQIVPYRTSRIRVRFVRLLPKYICSFMRKPYQEGGSMISRPI